MIQKEKQIYYFVNHATLSVNLAIMVAARAQIVQEVIIPMLQIHLHVLIVIVECITMIEEMTLRNITPWMIAMCVNPVKYHDLVIRIVSIVLWDGLLLQRPTNVLNAKCATLVLVVSKTKLVVKYAKNARLANIKVKTEKVFVIHAYRVNLT